MDQVYIKTLLDILDNHPGPKNLIIDHKLINTVNLFLQYQTLQEHKIVFIGNLNQHANQSLLTFYLILNPSLEIAMKVMDKNCTNIMLMAPRVSLSSQLKLEETNLQFMSVPIMWSLLDNDLYSLESPCFTDLFVNRNNSILYEVSRGLLQLQNCYGPIHRVMAKGDLSNDLKELLVKMNDIFIAQQNRNKAATPQEASLHSNQVFPITTYEVPVVEPTHSHSLDVIMFDRSLDFTTPCLKQLTYSGLLSEYCDYDCGHVDSDNPVKDPSKPTSAAIKKIKLKDDVVYDTIKDVNFIAVGPLLNRLAKSLQKDYDSRNQANTVGQIKAFVNKLGSLQNEHKSLRVHTNIAESIQKLINDDFHALLEAQQLLLNNKENFTFLDLVEEFNNRNDYEADMIRLLCLISQMNEGLKPKQFEFFKKEIISAYGIHYFEIIDNLQKAQVLFRKEDQLKCNYKSCRRLLKLNVDNINEKDPQDLAYVFSGNAPIIPRLVEHIINDSHPQNVEKLMTCLPGPFDDILMNTAIDKDVQKVLVVVIIGGITHAEISALRFAFKDKATQLKIVSTDILKPDFYKY